VQGVDVADKQNVLFGVVAADTGNQARQRELVAAKQSLIIVDVVRAATTHIGRDVDFSAGWPIFASSFPECGFLAIRRRRHGA